MQGTNRIGLHFQHICIPSEELVHWAIRSGLTEKCRTWNWRTKNNNRLKMSDMKMTDQTAPQKMKLLDMKMQVMKMQDKSCLLWILSKVNWIYIKLAQFATAHHAIHFLTLLVQKISKCVHVASTFRIFFDLICWRIYHRKTNWCVLYTGTNFNDDHLRSLSGARGLSPMSPGDSTFLANNNVPNKFYNFWTSFVTNIPRECHKWK